MNRLYVTTKGLRELKKRVDRHRAQEKWQSQTRSVAGEQQHAPANFTGSSCQREDSAQDRPDARSPSDGKGDAHQDRAQVARRFVFEVKLQITLQRRDFEKSDEIESYQKNKQAPQEANEIPVTQEETAEKTC